MFLYRITAMFITAIMTSRTGGMLSTYNPVLCQVMMTFQFIFLEASVFTRYILSVARYAAITRTAANPQNGLLRKILSFPIIKFILLLAWLTSILIIVIPKWFHTSSASQLHNKTLFISCSVLSSNGLSSTEKFYNLILSIVTIIIPSLLIIRNHVLILKYLRKSSRRIDNYNRRNIAVGYANLIANQECHRTSIHAIEGQMLRLYSLKRKRYKHQMLAYTIMILSATLILTYFPIVLVNIGAYFTRVAQTTVHLQVVLSISYINGIIPPFILLYRNPKLRLFVKSLFKRDLRIISPAR